MKKKISVSDTHIAALQALVARGGKAAPLTSVNKELVTLGFAIRVAGRIATCLISFKGMTALRDSTLREEDDGTNALEALYS
jgi:hypothetical protein